MAARPDVTVVIPTRNRVDLLKITVDSVLAQTTGAWETIVVDDGSDDGTAEEMTRRAAADSRIRYLRREGDKPGANPCRNQGIAEATADLIVLLDSDDLLRPDCLQRRVEVMAANRDLDFAVFRAEVFDAAPGDLGRLFHEQKQGDDLYRFVSHECVWQTTGPIWRKAFLDRIGGFDDDLLSMQDMDLHVRALAAGGRYLRYPDVDHDIRWQNDADRTSVRHYHDERFASAVEIVRGKMRRALEQGGEMSWSRSRALTGLSFGAAESLMRMGRTSAALALWRTGCERQGEGAALCLLGAAMLLGSKFGGGKLTNKWKGWVRFRQEPRLMDPAR